MFRNLIYILFFPVLAFGQHIPVGTISTSTRTWFTTLGTTPAPLTLYAVNNFINKETANANWGHLDRFFLYAQDNQTNAANSLVNPSNTLSAVNSPSWTAYAGYTSNGTSSYLNLNINPSTFGGNLTVNSASMGTYFTTSLQSNAYVSMGCSNGSTSSIQFFPNEVGSKTYCFMNDITASSVTNSGIKGLMHAERTSSTVVTVYIKGVSLGTTGATSSGIASYNIYSLCRNTAGAATLYDSNTHALDFIGDGSINASTFNSDVQSLATSLGFNQ